jgi:hypothetical protein
MHLHLSIQVAPFLLMIPVCSLAAFEYFLQLSTNLGYEYMATKLLAYKKMDVYSRLGIITLEKARHYNSNGYALACIRMPFTCNSLCSGLSDKPDHSYHQNLHISI